MNREKAIKIQGFSLCPEEMGRGRRESIFDHNCTYGSATYVGLAKPHEKKEHRLRLPRKLTASFYKEQSMS